MHHPNTSLKAVIGAILSIAAFATAEARVSLSDLQADIDLNAADIADVQSRSVAADGDTILVNSLANDIDPNDGECTLQEAVERSNDAGDSASAVVGECATGNNGSGQTLIDLRLLAGTLSLETGGLPDIQRDVRFQGPGRNGLTLGGRNSPGADAIQLLRVLAGTTVEVDAVTISGFFNIGGRALENYGNLTLTDVSVKENTQFGGVGVLYNEGALTIDRSTLTENYSNQGGAIVNDGGVVLLTNSRIFDNRSDVSGGAIVNRDSGAFYLMNNVLYGNENSTGADGNGGAIYNTGGTLELYNNLFSVPTPNSADADGDNVYNEPLGAGTVTAEGNLPTALGCNGAGASNC